MAARPLSAWRGRAVAVVALALLVAGCGSGGPGSTGGAAGSPIVVGGSPLLGKPAPPIELASLDGDVVRLADFAGRPVVVNFWASWCVPCREEFPAFVAAREANAAAGLEILGVIYKDDAESARRFAQDQGAAWPLLQDPEEKAYKAYTGFGGVPMSVFIDGAGVVRAVSYGPLTHDGMAQQLATIVPHATASPRASAD